MRRRRKSGRRRMRQRCGRRQWRQWRGRRRLRGWQRRCGGRRRCQGRHSVGPLGVVANVPDCNARRYAYKHGERQTHNAANSRRCCCQVGLLLFGKHPLLIDRISRIASVNIPSVEDAGAALVAARASGPCGRWKEHETTLTPSGRRLLEIAPAQRPKREPVPRGLNARVFDHFFWF